MDSARYYIAAFIISLFPTAMAFWLIVHPFIYFWRRFRPAVIYAIVFSMMTPIMIGLMMICPTLLQWDWGFRAETSIPGVLIVFLSVVLVFIRQRYFPIKTLSGLPELDPNNHHATLVTDGIYQLIRHPRYVEFALFGFGLSLIANYPAGYVTSVLCWGLIYLVALFEERELIERWGDEYRDYCKQTPRFVPRWSAIRRIMSTSE